MAEKDNKSKYQLAKEKLEKEFGKGTVVNGSSKSGEYDVVSTGSLSLDIATGVGGLAYGKTVELMGWESCIEENTYIKFLVIDPKTGKVQDCKGSSIKNLYNRFHSVKTHPNTINSKYYVIGINENDKIIRNPIANVVETGIKECFEITTKYGLKIEATAEHKFYQNGYYTPLSKLKVGDIISIHNNTPYKGRNNIRANYKESFVKYYYKGRQKKVKDHSTGKEYLYYRVKDSRLVYEAWLNNISLDKYIKMLNSISELPSSWITIPEGFHIHHRDENKSNNEINNLELIDSSSHGRLHAIERQDNLRFVAVDDIITSIKSVGQKQTYDIKCFYPYNNYVAAGFVVHNSGKSTITLNVIANHQKKNDGRVALLIDGEHSFDKRYAKVLGVDVDKLEISQPDYGEMAYNIAGALIETGDVGVVVIDSQTSLLPKKSMEGEAGDHNLGLHARLMSIEMPKLMAKAAKHNTLLIVISQFREKIGVMFGSPVTTNGGNALKFYAHMRLEVSKTIDKDSSGEKTGNKTKVVVKKNKLACPFAEAEFIIDWGLGINRNLEVLELAVEYGIVKKGGSWYTYGDAKVQGDDKMLALFADNPEFAKEIETKVLNKINGVNEENTIEENTNSTKENSTKEGEIEFTAPIPENEREPSYIEGNER